MKTLATVLLALCVLGVPLSSQPDSPNVLRAPEFLEISDPTFIAGSSYTGEAAAGRAQWIRTAESLATVTEDARKRLTALGWRVRFTQAAPAMTITRFAADTPTEQRVGILTLLALKPGQVVASVRLLRDVPPRGVSGRGGGGGANQSHAPPLDVAIKQLLVNFPAPGPNEPGYQRLAAIPPDFPALLVPRGFVAHTVLTSASRTTIVGIVGNADATELAPLLNGIRQAGWNERSMAGGFYTDLVSASFCEGSRVVDVGLQDRPDRAAIVGISLNPKGRCMSSGVLPKPQTAMPLLRVLPQWAPENRTGSRNPGLNQSQIRLTANPSPTQLWTHFEPQMRAAGFVADPRLGDVQQLVGRFTLKPAQGTSFTAVLAFTIVPGSKSMDAHLEVFRNEGR